MCISFNYAVVKVSCTLVELVSSLFLDVSTIFLPSLCALNEVLKDNQKEKTISHNLLNFSNYYSYVCLCILSLLGNGQQQFAERPQNTSVNQGQMAVLRCRVLNQQGRVQWTKDGFALGEFPFFFNSYFGNCFTTCIVTCSLHFFLPCLCVMTTMRLRRNSWKEKHETKRRPIFHWKKRTRWRGAQPQFVELLVALNNTLCVHHWTIGLCCARKFSLALLGLALHIFSVCLSYFLLSFQLLLAAQVL